MRVSEIKGALERMSAVDRARVQGCLRILRWKETPGLAELLARLHREMDVGKKRTADEAERNLRRFRCESLALSAYRYVLTDQVFEAYVALPDDEADLLCSFFRWLTSHPETQGDGSQVDSEGRPHYASLCGPFLVVHWTDHPAREVRVVQVLRQ